MDDLRIHWIKDRVFASLDIPTDDFDVFDEFLMRDDGENEMKIAKFINQTEEDHDNALIFNKECKEEDIEVLIELSNKKKIASFAI